jgi:site-specific recombinase XerD
MQALKDKSLFVSIREYLETYLPKIRCRSAETVRTSRTALNLLLEFYEQVLAINLFSVSTRDLNQKNIYLFVDWLVTERANKPSTANERLSRVKAFLGYLARHCNPSDIVILDSVREVSGLPEVTGEVPKSLSLPEVKLLLNAPDTTLPIEFRDAVFMTMMYDTGCRDNEIRSILLKDITIGADTGNVKVMGKGNRARLVPLSSQMVVLLKKYLDVFHPDGNLSSLLFFVETKVSGRTKMSNDNSLRIFKKYEKRVAETVEGYPHIHPHTLRHSRAQNLYDAGMSLPLVCEWLGHSDLSVTRVYARASLEMKKRAVEKATVGENPILPMESPIHASDKETIKRLYGLK